MIKVKKVIKSLYLSEEVFKTLSERARKEDRSFNWLAANILEKAAKETKGK